MEKDQRTSGSEVVRDQSTERAQRPAPGKVTRTSRLAPRPGQVAQRRVAAAIPDARPVQRRSAWDQTMDPWMDAAHRGCSATVPVQRKEETAGAVAQPPNTSGGGGQSLPESVQAKMEQAFGADFSAVRVHQGPHVQALGALAYTQGNDVHFAPGQYDPGSQRGQELLGHELTHVVQQSQGRVRATAQANGWDVNDDAGLEAEADAMGVRAARGQRVSGASSPGQVTGGSAAIQMMRASDVVNKAWYVTKDGQRLWLVQHARGKYEFSLEQNGEATVELTNATEFEPDAKEVTNENTTHNKRKRSGSSNKPDTPNKRARRATRGLKPEVSNGPVEAKLVMYTATGTLYHSSDVQLAGEQLKDQPTYFFPLPGNHNKELYSFKLRASVEVVDLTRPESVAFLLKSIDKDEVKQVLIYKTRAEFGEDGKLVAVGQFRSPSREEDKVLETWFQQNGYSGWFGNLGFLGEIMLTSTHNKLEAGQKYNW